MYYGIVCRVVHILRTTPPSQTATFSTSFDATIRTCFQDVHGDFSAAAWAQIQLPFGEQG